MATKAGRHLQKSVMSDLAQIQQEFMALLRTNDRALENDIIQAGMLNNTQRADIYRSAYRIRLRGVLDSDHAMLGIYLGDDLFEQMVEGYIDAMPSQHPSLRYFGDRLPDFLQHTLPFSSHPILAEISAFERILLNAFDSADADRLTSDLLQNIPADKWPVLKFDFHPSLHTFQCHWNAVESWQSIKNDQAPPSPARNENTHIWAVWRGPKILTEYKSISFVEHLALSSMQQQSVFAEVCETIQDHIPEDQIAATLFGFVSSWLDRGWITSAHWQK